MDITKTVEPKSDQLNFDDVAAVPLTITVVSVKGGPDDQPVHLHNAEFPGRPYKPGKSMRRVLIAAWGAQAEAYVGKKLTLYGDPSIKFGKEAVGGIRISHLSHLEKQLTVPLTVTRGKRAPFTVMPLIDQVTVDALIAHLGEAAGMDQLLAVWELAVQSGVAWVGSVVKAKDARKAELAAS